MITSVSNAFRSTLSLIIEEIRCANAFLFPIVSIDVWSLSDLPQTIQFLPFWQIDQSRINPTMEPKYCSSYAVKHFNRETIRQLDTHSCRADHFDFIEVHRRGDLHDRISDIVEAMYEYEGVELKWCWLPFDIWSQIPLIDRIVLPKRNQSGEWVLRVGHTLDTRNDSPVLFGDYCHEYFKCNLIDVFTKKNDQFGMLLSWDCHPNLSHHVVRIGRR